MTLESILEDLGSHKYIFVREEGILREAADILKEAYDRLKSLGASISWYQSRESLSSKEANFDTVFVMNRFDTTLYEELKGDYRIINPICVITSLNCYVKIPLSSYRSLASMALRSCRVTSNSFSKEQTSLIRERVSLMAGKYTQNLQANTTHLISEGVHSEKYDRAVKNRIPVVLCSWLDEAWVSSRSNPNFSAFSPWRTNKHRCPVFLKCNVIVSGFTCEEERDEIVNLLKSNRANYTNDIVVDGESQTTHLVTTQTVSNTLKIAHERHIFVLTKDWVTDCVKHAYRLPEENYSPEFKQNKVVTVTHEKRNTISEVITDKLNELNFEVDSCGEFLGGYIIYLCGFTDTQTNHLNKFLNLCKATRLSKLNVNVTHVVLGCPTDKQYHEVANFSPASSFVLKYDWLIECWKQQSALSESKFIVKVAEIDKPSKKASNGKYLEGSDADNKLYLPELSKHTKVNFLSNLNFWLIDPPPLILDKIKRSIIKNGGNLITKDTAITPDYIIVPLNFDDSITNKTMLVTLYWLQSSLFAKRLLVPFEDPLFTPASRFGCRNILSDTTVMVTKKRDRSIRLISIEQFLSYMGARVTHKLTDILPVDVVINDDSSHELARNAKELDVPVVRLKWMIQCAHTNTKLPFTDFYTFPSSQSSETPESFSLMDVISDDLSSGLLVGTKIAFSNIFTPQEIIQMVNIVTESGGVYSDLYTSQVTHYIYSTKSIWSKESLLAKKENAAVVHPKWLFDIKKSSIRLNVIDYPPSFDPDNIIGCVKVEKADAGELMDTTQFPIKNDTFDLLNFTSSIPDHSHGYEEISSKSRCNTLQLSGSWKADSNNSLNSSLYSSQHPNHIFMFSCIELELRIRLGEIIKFLGGKYFIELSYDQHYTHLISGKVKTHEKLFCAMAAGLYILKPEYIFQCEIESKFVEEEPFEWGNNSIGKPILSDKRLLATYWWRKELEERVLRNRSGMSLRKPPKTGVFEGWSVYLGCRNCKVKECKIQICEHIISAGRGRTTHTINQRSNLTIAILDLHCISNTNLRSFKKFGIKVASCQYVIEYLDNLGDEMQLKRFVLQEALP